MCVLKKYVLHRTTHMAKIDVTELDIFYISFDEPTVKNIGQTY